MRRALPWVVSGLAFAVLASVLRLTLLDRAAERRLAVSTAPWRSLPTPPAPAPADGEPLPAT